MVNRLLSNGICHLRKGLKRLMPRILTRTSQDDFKVRYILEWRFLDSAPDRETRDIMVTYCEQAENMSYSWRAKQTSTTRDGIVRMVGDMLDALENADWVW